MLNHKSKLLEWIICCIIKYEKGRIMENYENQQNWDFSRFFHDFDSVFAKRHKPGGVHGVPVLRQPRYQPQDSILKVIVPANWPLNPVQWIYPGKQSTDATESYEGETGKPGDQGIESGDKDAKVHGVSTGSGQGFSFRYPTAQLQRKRE